MKEPIFYLTNGDLSAYSFACGYVQKYTVKGAEAQMYMEHAHYHVTFVVLKSDGSRERVYWDCFETLTEARKRFAEFKRIAKNEYN